MGDPYALLELAGVVAFAVSGAAVGVRAGMDWLGIAVLAVVTSIGGGTLRDLLLNQRPGWMADPWPVWVALGTSVLVIADAYRAGRRREPDERRIILVADAAGLALFAVAGTEIALAAGVTDPVAVLLGTMTGVGGGVARDVLAGQRPLVLAGQIYALTALAGGVTLVLLLRTDLDPSIARWTAAAPTLVLRLLAIRYDWTLPPLPAVRGPAT